MPLHGPLYSTDGTRHFLRTKGTDDVKNFLLRLLDGILHASNLKRALRGALVTFAVLFVPGLLGWLHDLTAWANSRGSTAFPDAHGLLYLAVSALVAAVVGLVNLLLNAVETASGHGLLRMVPPVSPDATKVPVVVQQVFDPVDEANRRDNP